MNQYETVFILTPVLSDVQMKEAVEKFKSILTAEGAEIVNEENWGLKKLAYPIQNSSMANSVVLDPFGGSGSTLIACEQTNRICHTIELDEKFCDVIVKRYIEQVGSAENVSVVRDGKTIAYSELEVTDEE